MGGWDDYQPVPDVGPREVSLFVRIPADAKERLRSISNKSGLPMGRIVELLINAEYDYGPSPALQEHSRW